MKKELKSIEALLPIHQAQLLTYLKLTGIKVGLLINFNVPDGIKRIVNKLWALRTEFIPQKAGRLCGEKV